MALVQKVVGVVSVERVVLGLVRVVDVVVGVDIRDSRG